MWPNMRAECNDDDNPQVIIRDTTITGQDGEPQERTAMPIFNPEEMIGRTFVLPIREDRQHHRARIVEAIEAQDNDPEQQAKIRKFRCSINKGEYEEVLLYNQILYHIDEDDAINRETVWRFKCIVGNEGPRHTMHPSYNGSSYDIILEWESGEITAEPLTIISKCDLVTCAIYARENNLLDTPGWRQFKPIAKQQKKMFRMVNQAKLRSHKTAKKYNLWV